MAMQLARVLLLVFLSIFSFVQFGESASFTRPLVLRNATSERPKQYNQTVYKPLFNPPSNSTPRFINVTQQNVNPLFQVASALEKRAVAAEGDGTCAPGSPCSNGACCSSSGFCGYSPDFCGTENCISNCDAKAACGQYAEEGKEKCPLNVCCVRFLPNICSLTLC